ncbi:DUF433 domain-containing protein [Rhizorhabdus wittichii]|uniref:DUF433 domain-containing protein n=1 Tax=Rhizorhabdus wittichii TaxID=160791 RepID=A0A975HEH0_9SPHN|nr:DUF433 domain-containing protein [Rhizorhabdus wittichii]
MLGDDRLDALASIADSSDIAKEAALEHSPINADPLLAGFYSPADAARLLQVASPKLRGWLNGWGNSAAGPIVDRDFKHSRTISFLDLMEMRFIEAFRRQGVSMQTLRAAAARARKEWDQPHPFALSRARYLTDRRSVFAQVAEQQGDRMTWDMASGQHEMWDVIEATIAKGVEFDPASELARRWYPLPAEFPKISVDPAVAFGKPALIDERIPTAAIHRMWKAEGGSIRRVADAFEISEDAVRAAVEYEITTAN